MLLHTINAVEYSVRTKRLPANGVASHLAGASIGAVIALLDPALYSNPHGYGNPKERGFRARAFLYVLRSLGSLTNKADEEFRLL